MFLRPKAAPISHTRVLALSPKKTVVSDEKHKIIGTVINETRTSIPYLFATKGWYLVTTYFKYSVQ